MTGFKNVKKTEADLSTIIMNKDDNNKRPHAIALYSGGLDSNLAILLMLRQDIRVTALYFVHYFGSEPDKDDPSDTNPYRVAEKFGFELKVIHLGRKFIDIVVKPKHGRGGHMNPCVDCKILMLRQAKAYMEKIGADFIITGEVQGQRPFSQLKHQMDLVLRKSELGNKLLRPLCARLLPLTEPEQKGLVDREKLLDIQGRNRKRQIALAEEYGLDDYPTPAGGCLLTDAGYSNRLRDLLDNSKTFTPTDIRLLKYGRHFRLDEKARAVVGRNEKENLAIEQLIQPEHLLFEALEVGSPLTLLIGEASNNNIETAALLTARYSSAKNETKVKILVKKNNEELTKLTVNPVDDFDPGLKAIT